MARTVTIAHFGFSPKACAACTASSKMSPAARCSLGVSVVRQVVQIMSSVIRLCMHVVRSGFIK